MWVPTRALLNSMLNNVGHDTIQTVPLLRGGYIGLIRQTAAFSVDSVLDDLVEANYEGYARGHLTIMTAAHIGQNGKSLTEGDTFIFQPTGDDSPNTIFGHFWLGADSVTLLAGELFDAPIPLPDENYAFTDVPIFGLDPLANYGSSLVSN